MNYARDFTTDQQDLMKKLNIQIENKEYSSDDIKKDLTTIITHVMSKSAKNNDLANEMARYNSVMSLLVKNEK